MFDPGGVGEWSPPQSPVGGFRGKKEQRRFITSAGSGTLKVHQLRYPRFKALFHSKWRRTAFLRFAAPRLLQSRSDNSMIDRSAEYSMRLRDLINRPFSCLCHFDPHRERLFKFGDVGDHQDQIEIILDAVDRGNQMLPTTGVLGPKPLIDK